MAGPRKRRRRRVAPAARLTSAGAGKGFDPRTLRRSPDEVKAEQARRAVALMRSKMPGLNSYAKAVTNDPGVNVVLAAGRPCTDGKNIYLRPPMELGQQLIHDVGVCGQRDIYDILKCHACQTEEEINILLRHEIGHILYKSFESMADSDKVAMLKKSIADGGEGYAERIRAKLEDAEEQRRVRGQELCLIDAAKAISPWLVELFNALEDARVNIAMYGARPGLYKQFRSRANRIFQEGMLQDDGSILAWHQLPENSQVMCAMLCKAMGYEYKDHFSERVIETVDAPEVAALVKRVQTARSARSIFMLGFPIMRELKKRGYCSDEDDRPEEFPDLKTPEDRAGDEGKGREQKESKPGDGTSDTPDGEGTGADDKDDEESDEGEGRDSDGELAEDDDEGDGDGAGAPDPDSDDDESDSDGPGGPEEPDEDEDGADGGARPDVPEEGAYSGATDDEDAVDLPDEDGGAAGAGEDEEDIDGVDGDADEFDAPFHDDEDGHDDDSDDFLDDEDDDEDEDDYDDEDEDDLDDDESDDYNDEGAGEGTDSGGSDMMATGGTPEEAREALAHMGGHSDFDIPGLGYDEDERPQPEGRDEMELDRAIIQGDHFDAPSMDLFGVNEWRNEDGPIYEDYGNVPDSEIEIFDIPESILSPALREMRIAFDNNKRVGHQRNMTSGSVNAKVLGRRVPTNDERLFQKKRLPAKRDYFVVLGLDMSGSTGYGAAQRIKSAAFAQAELLHRLGVKFAVYAHSGSHDQAFGLPGLDIAVIKEPDQRWDTAAKVRLMRIGHSQMNLDGHTMEYYRKVCDKVRATDKLIMYYTDGAMPCENFEEELTVLQREIKNAPRHGVTIVGIGVGTDAPIQHGLDTIRLDRVEDILKVVQGLRERLAS